MIKKLYVGNLPYSVTNDALGDHLATIGEVISVNIIFDRYTGRSKGFGFVEMASEELAQAAVESLDGKEFEGRTLKVAEAHPPRRDRGPRRDDW
jgi:RNA recognition motif-containing protein